MFRDPSSRAARAVAAGLMLGAPILIYRAAVLIAAGHAARYVVWLQALTWVELGLAVSISAAALVWLVSGAGAWCALTLRLTVAIVLLHAFRVAVFVIGRVGPWVDLDLRPEERPLDPGHWDWFQIWSAGGLAVASLVLLVAAMIVSRRKRAIHN